MNKLSDSPYQSPVRRFSQGGLSDKENSPEVNRLKSLMKKRINLAGKSVFDSEKKENVQSTESVIEVKLKRGTTLKLCQSCVVLNKELEEEIPKTQKAKETAQEKKVRGRRSSIGTLKSNKNDENPAVEKKVTRAKKSKIQDDNNQLSQAGTSTGENLETANEPNIPPIERKNSVDLQKKMSKKQKVDQKSSVDAVLQNIEKNCFIGASTNKVLKKSKANVHQDPESADDIGTNNQNAIVGNKEHFNNITSDQNLTNDSTNENNSTNQGLSDTMNMNDDEKENSIFHGRDESIDKIRNNVAFVNNILKSQLDTNSAVNVLKQGKSPLKVLTRSQDTIFGDINDGSLNDLSNHSISVEDNASHVMNLNAPALLVEKPISDDAILMIQDKTPEKNVEESTEFEKQTSTDEPNASKKINENLDVSKKKSTSDNMKFSKSMEDTTKDETKSSKKGKAKSGSDEKNGNTDKKESSKLFKQKNDKKRKEAKAAQRKLKADMKMAKALSEMSKHFAQVYVGKIGELHVNPNIEDDSDSEGDSSSDECSSSCSCRLESSDSGSSCECWECLMNESSSTDDSSESSSKSDSGDSISSDSD